jgi:hypothetical protein
MEHFSIHRVEIAANKKQGRLIFLWHPQDNFVHFTDTVLNVNFELAETVGIAFRVDTLPFESFEGDAHVIAVFFKHDSDGNQIIGSKRAAGLLKLGIAQFYQQLGTMNRVAFVIEVSLQFGDSVRSGAEPTTNQGHAQPQSTNHSPGHHHYLLCSSTLRNTLLRSCACQT